jgi:hypothetical protein
VWRAGLNEDEVALSMLDDNDFTCFRYPDIPFIKYSFHLLITLRITRHSLSAKATWTVVDRAIVNADELGELFRGEVIGYIGIDDVRVP